MQGALQGLAAPLAALLGLNALLVIGDFVEARRALIPTQLSLELVAGLGVLALLAMRGGRRPAAMSWLVGVVLAAVGALRLADIMVPWYFGRDFNAAVDLKFLPVFLGMVHDAMPAGRFALLLAGGGLGLLTAVWVLRWAVEAAWRAAQERRVAPFAAAALTVAAAWVASVPSGSAGPPVAAKAADVVQRNLAGWLNAAGLRREYAARIDAAVAARAPDPAFAALRGRNVLLIFIESYGAVTFTDPAFAAALREPRARLDRALAGAGYHVATGLLESPITGGGSWMAHATLTAGVKVEHQALYDVLLSGSTRTLGGLFREVGYRTVAAMPRLQQPWPEGAFFGFDKVYYDWDFAYAGRRFSWESIPDQLVLEAVHRRELAAPARPVFIQYVLASSHAPFDLIPPVVPDGAAIGDGRIYRDLPAAAFPLKDGRVFEQNDGYVAAIAYVLGALERYLVDRLADDSLVIVLGDHQPPLSVASASRDKAVPIYVLSRDAALVAPFRAAGFVPGVTPVRTGPVPPMDGFLNRLIDAYRGRPGEG